MPFAPDIDHHRQALLRLVVMLFGVPGLGPSGTMALSKIMRSTVLFYLRPMESATVRLIAAMASLLKQSGYVLPKLRSAQHAPSQPVPVGMTGNRKPVFPLFDARRSHGTGAPRPKYAKHDPIISYFDSRDCPRTPLPETQAPRTDGLIGAARVARRLAALRGALDDLEKQAKRLLRSQAKREAAGKPFRSPIRTGRPPGHRTRCQWEVDEILRDCHQLALGAIRAPDTS